MIDEGDVGKSSVRLLIFQALQLYATPALFQYLDDENNIVRSAAARELHIRGGQEVFEKSVELLSKSSSKEREIGGFILGQLGTPTMPFREASIPLLEKALNDRSSNVRATAAAALGHLEARESIDSLLRASEDKNPDVRACVAATLSRFRENERVRLCLAKLRADESADVRFWASD